MHVIEHLRDACFGWSIGGFLLKLIVFKAWMVTQDTIGGKILRENGLVLGHWQAEGCTVIK